MAVRQRTRQICPAVYDDLGHSSESSLVGWVGGTFVETFAILPLGDDCLTDH